MTQHTFSVANQSRTAYRGDVNSALQALVSQSSGATEPATRWSYQIWGDTTLAVIKQRNAANSAWIVRDTLAETLVLSRSSNTVLGVGDYGRTIIATSSFTQTFDAAATLKDGWHVLYRNDGAGVITLDPNASETIDGATTLALNPGESCVILCNGSAFKTVGRGALILTGDVTGSGTGSFAATIAADAVTNAKLANMAQSTIKGRAAGAGTGDPTDLSVAQAKTLLGYTARDLARWESSSHTITASSTLAQAHGLGTLPILVQVVIQCQTAELGFSTGDEVQYTTGVNAGNISANAVSADATNVYVGTMNAIFVIRRDTHVQAAITLANWSYTIRAWV